jgi:hypothetical protein
MLLAGLVVLAGSVGQAFAQPTPAQMLDPKLAPKFDDVPMTVPTPDELKSCTVKLVNGATPKSNGWLLSDATGKPLRRYFDSTGAGKVDMWSYFKDGVEVYREFDSTGKGSPNNFRWLNAGGMKWGVGGFDAKTGKWSIHSWRMISAEEVGFEAFQAVAKNDLARLESLFITDSDMRTLKLPAAKAQAIAAIQKTSVQKFDKLVQTVKLAGVKFDGVESAVPHCDTTGDVETIKFPSRAVRYLAGDKHHWLHTGEMIQVGMVWRLVDVPTDKENVLEPQGGTVVKNDPKLEKALNDLASLDKDSPPSASLLANNAAVDAYFRKRIDLVFQIIPLEKESDRETWYKQLCDNRASLAQNKGDEASLNAMTQLRDAIVADKKLGTNLAAYGTYKEMWTRYIVGVSKAQNPPDDKMVAKLTDKWLDDLSDFVQKYSKADDTPDALNQLAVGCEFAGKIAQAKRWYKVLADSFPEHYHTPRAKGALARLNLVGNEMTLSMPMLVGGKMFNVNELKGKLVVVHYWSTASASHQDDFNVLKRVIAQAAKSNVELVSISLDDDANKASAAIAKAQAPGVHLFQAPPNNAGGMNSAPAIQYGIHILPTVFLIGRDGRVINNSLQVNEVETELKKVQ